MFEDKVTEWAHLLLLLASCWPLAQALVAYFKKNFLPACHSSNNFATRPTG